MPSGNRHDPARADHDELVVRIVAVPKRPTDGARLASEILAVARSRRPVAQAA